MLQAICQRLIPQPDRPADPVPIVPFIDEQLHQNQGDGYRYESLPPQRDAWRIGIRAIEEEARARWARGFRDLRRQSAGCGAAARCSTATAHRRLAGHAAEAVLFKSVLLHEAVGVYYAHPAAWSEIGFGGPAAPRGYVRMQAEPARPVGGAGGGGAGGGGAGGGGADGGGAGGDAIEEKEKNER